ncbi:peroxisome- protein [Perkinsus chesapeaki]|uniref:Peroxisome- protein n=1 Tax=Perkinsus chesapeaki TaxID=330153 RepID=A0A7J6MAL7_PERCH|nr:peroxisome- protein [Perkinsus chesapeaki]
MQRSIHTGSTSGRHVSVQLARICSEATNDVFTDKSMLLTRLRSEEFTRSGDKFSGELLRMVTNGSPRTLSPSVWPIIANLAAKYHSRRALPDEVVTEIIDTVGSNHASWDGRFAAYAIGSFGKLCRANPRLIALLGPLLDHHLAPIDGSSWTDVEGICLRLFHVYKKNPREDSFVHVFLPPLCKRLRGALLGAGALPSATELDGILNFTSLLGQDGVDASVLVVDLMEKIGAHGQSGAIVHACLSLVESLALRPLIPRCILITDVRDLTNPKELSSLLSVLASSPQLPDFRLAKSHLLKSPILSGNSASSLSADEVALVARSLAGVGQADGTAASLESIIWKLGEGVFGSSLKGISAASVVAFMRAVTWCTGDGPSDLTVQLFDSIGPFLLDKQYPPEASPGRGDFVTVAVSLARLKHKDASKEARSINVRKQRLHCHQKAITYVVGREYWVPLLVTLSSLLRKHVARLSAAECVALISAYSRLDQREAEFLTLVSHRLIVCDSLGDAIPGIFEVTSSTESIKKRRARHEALPRPASGEGVTMEQLCVAVSSLGAMDVISPDFARWVTTKVRKYPVDGISSDNVRDILVGFTRTGKADWVFVGAVPPGHTSVHFPRVKEQSLQVVLFDILLSCLPLDATSKLIIGAVVNGLRHVNYRKADFLSSVASTLREPVGSAIAYHAISSLDLIRVVETASMPGLEELVLTDGITPVMLSGALEYFIKSDAGLSQDVIRKAFAKAHPTSELMSIIVTELPRLICASELRTLRALTELVNKAKPGFANNPPLAKTIVAEVQHTVSRIQYSLGGPAAADCRRTWVTREAGLELYADIVLNPTQRPGVTSVDVNVQYLRIVDIPAVDKTAAAAAPKKSSSTAANLAKEGRVYLTLTVDGSGVAVSTDPVEVTEGSLLLDFSNQPGIHLPVSGSTSDKDTSPPTLRIRLFQNLRSKESEQKGKSPKLVIAAEGHIPVKSVVADGTGLVDDSGRRGSGDSDTTGRITDVELWSTGGQRVVAVVGLMASLSSRRPVTPRHTSSAVKNPINPLVAASVGRSSAAGEGDDNSVDTERLYRGESPQLEGRKLLREITDKFVSSKPGLGRASGVDEVSRVICIAHSHDSSVAKI